MPNVTGTVQSKSRKGNSIQVDGEWYSVFAAADMPAEWKDEVSFNWDYDKSGKYRNIAKGTVKVLNSGGGGETRTVSKGFSNLGVELGHASNVAKDMAIAKFPSEEVGSTAFYKFWLDETQKVYDLMKGLRTKYEGGGTKTATPVAETEPDLVTTDDIF